MSWPCRWLIWKSPCRRYLGNEHEEWLWGKQGQPSSPVLISSQSSYHYRLSTTLCKYSYKGVHHHPQFASISGTFCHNRCRRRDVRAALSLTAWLHSRSLRVCVLCRRHSIWLWDWHVLWPSSSCLASSCMPSKSACYSFRLPESQALPDIWANCAEFSHACLNLFGVLCILPGWGLNITAAKKLQFRTLLGYLGADEVSETLVCKCYFRVSWRVSDVTRSHVCAYLIQKWACRSAANELISVSGCVLIPQKTEAQVLFFPHLSRIGLVRLHIIWHIAVCPKRSDLPTGFGVGRSLAWSGLGRSLAWHYAVHCTFKLSMINQWTCDDCCWSPIGRI